MILTEVVSFAVGDIARPRYFFLLPIVHPYVFMLILGVLYVHGQSSSPFDVMYGTASHYF